MLNIRPSRTRRGLLAALTLLLILPGTALSQGMGSKRPLTHDDYDAWKSIRGNQISADGKWIAYQIAPQEGDGELVVRSVGSTTEYRQPRGERASFTKDSRYLVFLVAPAEDSVKAAQKAKKKGPDLPKRTLGIMDLRNGSVRTVERVKGFALPEEASGWVAYHMEEPPTAPKEEAEGEEAEAAEPAAAAPAGRGARGARGAGGQGAAAEGDAKKKDYGTELIIEAIGGGQQHSFASVMEFRFTKDGKRLLYTVSSKEEPATDGVYAYQPGSAEPQALLTGEGNYKRWAMNEDETYLAFLTDRDDYAAKKPTFNLYGWKVGNGSASLWVSHTSTAGFPSGMAVSDLSGISLTDDGSIVSFGIKEIPEAEPEAEKGEEADEEEQAKFELWSWNDPYPYPQQKVMADRMRNRTWDAVYHVNSGRFVKLADEDVPSVELTDDGRVGFAATDVPYTERVSYDSAYYDFYMVDPMTGDRKLIKKESYFRGSLSPTGRYVTWFGTDRHWYCYDTSTGTTSNLTAGLEIPFHQIDWDTPNYPSAYGTAGWTRNDESVLVYDEYDIWEMKPDGSDRRNITEGYGRAHDISFRYMRMDRNEDTIDPNATLMLRTTNTQTMASGFYTDRVKGTKEPQKLIMEDRGFGFPTKADDADVLLYTRSAYDEFPDLWVSDTAFKKSTKLSDVGKQMDAFTWGKAELLHYVNADGIELKGILIKPDGYRPGQNPTMVYIYEQLSQGLHSFRNPGPGSSVNPAYYVSNGYVMWMPDIIYGTGHPGQDALNCVVPSVEMLIAEGIADPERIGIQGHSWGGYQIAYMITQTDIFTAVESGAPVSNMTSAYGGIRWGSGMVRQFQYERTQSRLGRTLWDGGLSRYVENSPVFYADNVNTPILILHNDQDDAVPWYQGIELIMALRRLQKPAWMYNYNGEPHGIRKRVNQKDWTIRMQEFFDHYLKGTPAPDWMKKGIQAWDVEGGGR